MHNLTSPMWGPWVILQNVKKKKKSQNKNRSKVLDPRVGAMVN